MRQSNEDVCRLSEVLSILLSFHLSKYPFKHILLNTMAKIIVTGGTFDKDYEPTTGELVFLRDSSSVHQILERARVQDHSVEIAMMIDSLEMTATNRESLAVLCKQSQENEIVITHGTDTMCETAQVLQGHNLAKTIVLTGAMRPHKLGNSDATFNLGFALAVSSMLPQGVYIAMNGQVFNPDDVQKNRSTLRFERIG